MGAVTVALVGAVAACGRLGFGVVLTLAGVLWALDVGRVASRARDLDTRAAAVLLLPVPPLWFYRACGLLAGVAGLAATARAV